MLATMEAVDIRGFMLPIKSEGGRPITTFSIPSWMPGKRNVIVCLPDGTIVPAGKWDGDLPRIGILGLDEFGQSSDEIKKAAAELLLHGQVGDDPLPTVGWRVIACSNRLKDRSGVLRPLTFVTNRRLALNIDAEVAPWNVWVENLPPQDRPHFLTCSFANQQSHLVFRDEVPPGDEPFCTPRTLVMMDRALMALRSSEEEQRNLVPTDNIARQVAAGLIGGGESAQYFTHVRFADLIPTMAQIVRDPRGAKLPEERSAQMVAAFMIAQQVEKRSLEPCLTYIFRLGAEMQILCLRMMGKHREKGAWLFTNPAYSKWADANKETLMASYA
jgi:hypothetical protein